MIIAILSYILCLQNHPSFYSIKVLKSDLDATRLQENTPKIQNFPGEHAPGPLVYRAYGTRRAFGTFHQNSAPPPLINIFLRLYTVIVARPGYAYAIA